MLNSAHQGYIYQDILAAYFVAHELACGNGNTTFHFDHKKTSNDVPDKFDDLSIYYGESQAFFQIKYSNDDNQHTLTKADFAAKGNYDLALFDLFKTWKALHNNNCSWRVLLAWDLPAPDDPIVSALSKLSDNNSLIPGTTCYQFNCDYIWPLDNGVLSRWQALKKESQSINRREFKAFLDSLIIEVNCPKSSLLLDYNQGLEKLLKRKIEEIGIGTYPNDHLTVRNIAESLCTITKRRRAESHNTPISCSEIAQEVNIVQAYGGLEQSFSIDETVLVNTPNRIEQIVSALQQHSAVLLTAEPGAGKSWFIENLQAHLGETTIIIKHYCYVALNDPLVLKRITVNAMYGSLITQLIDSDSDLRAYKIKKYASNLEELNNLLRVVQNRTLLIVDGIDHIWRVYQNNRGGLTETETEILQALAQLDFANPNISLLVVSQPIEELQILKAFHPCKLAPMDERFVEQLLEKHTITNSEIDNLRLSKIIHEKSQGNALYSKYLVDHVLTNKEHSSFEWIYSLPAYEFNLKSYYQYLYDQLQGNIVVANILCGAEFSLTESELQEITHLGEYVQSEVTLLKPILKYVATIGYSIYHESFKRFVINTIDEKGMSIEHNVYRPLIEWLEKHDFFTSLKAYSHLLKLYFEIGEFDKITQTISVDFIEDSLYYAQPFHSIIQNHNLQEASLPNLKEFVPTIVIAEQSKIIDVLDKELENKVLISYLKAIQKIHGEEYMYRVLWDNENILVKEDDALRFLVEQAYQGSEIVHWSISPQLSSISYESLGLHAVKLLHMKRYQEFDALAMEIYQNPKHRHAFKFILDETEWWTIYTDEDWKDNTPYFKNTLTRLQSTDLTLKYSVQYICSNERFIYDNDWRERLQDIVILTKSADGKEIEEAIAILSEKNWFYNWLIYLIKITVLSFKEFSNKELIEAFSYLVRDLEPFKGSPRVCDLYSQLGYIYKTFYLGLSLCKEDTKLLIECAELLEKVTTLSTGVQNSYSGPLTEEGYLKLVNNYLPNELVIDKYEQFYQPQADRKWYHELARASFNYACELSNLERYDEAKEKYGEGIQSLTAYGLRKDRTLSEVLDSSVVYQESYGSLNVDWFYELYQMAMTVVAHTDGKSTSSYPNEWFEEFIKVYPNEALTFLAHETFYRDEAHWHFENMYHFILKECMNLFSPTQWFLLCRSLPLAASNEIVSYGLDIRNQIDSSLQDAFDRWLQSLPFVIKDAKYPDTIVTRFKQLFDIDLALNDESMGAEIPRVSEESELRSEFPTTSTDDVLAFLEEHSPKSYDASNIRQFLHSINDVDEKKKILRHIANSFRFTRHIENWLDSLFELGSEDWFYFNVCLFVFLRDGWFHGLHHTHYLKQAYDVNSNKTISILQEILSRYVFEGGYKFTVSGNLIKALSELQVEKEIVQEVFHTTHNIIKRRLPYPKNIDVNTSKYQGLQDFRRDEMVVALLISRLKTLTTEKTQGIIWSLTYLAKTRPETLIKPYIWAFSQHKLLLPIHRALLLQILLDFVNRDLVPNLLVNQFLNIYPTGFFLEDQYIRSFVDFNIELNGDSINSFQLESHEFDEQFFPNLHFKYRALVSLCGSVSGVYKAYEYKRDKINKKHDSYWIRTDEIMTPIVPLANAGYEIANSHFHESLKQLTSSYGKSYKCNLQFLLSEVIVQIGGLTKRPINLPTGEDFPIFEIRSTLPPIEDNGWVILASVEKELRGERNEPKREQVLSTVIGFGERPTEDGDFTSPYLFTIDQYSEDSIEEMPVTKPICFLSIFDTLERSTIIYVSPFIIKALELKIDSNFHSGFIARNSEGEAIIKLDTWKQNYYGSIDDGTEVPGSQGAAVKIKTNYYQVLLDLYDDEGWFVLKLEDEWA